MIHSRSVLDLLDGRIDAGDERIAGRGSCGWKVPAAAEPQTVRPGLAPAGSWARTSTQSLSVPVRASSTTDSSTSGCVSFGSGSETSKKGQIWTWTGPWITRSSSRPPGADPAQINLFYGHIVTNTWHRNSVTNPVGGVWMSPAIPTGGLAAADTNNWKRLFVYEQYQPDPFM